MQEPPDTACEAVRRVQHSTMSQRRFLFAALLIAAAVAFYFWKRPGNSGPEKPKSPQEIEAGERAKADPFPDKQP